MKNKLITLLLIAGMAINIGCSKFNDDISNSNDIDNKKEDQEVDKIPSYVKIKYNPSILGKRAKENLSDEAIRFYEEILIPGVLNRDLEIKIPNEITENEKALITNYFQQNCPLEYFAGTPFLNVKGDTILFDYTNCYYMTEEQYNKEIEKISTSIENIINNNIKDSYNYLEMIFVLYKYLSENTTYNLEARSTSAYGVLVNNEGICGGFSQALQVLLNQLELDEGYQVEWNPGDDRPGHVWNALMLDNNWYYFDATWENGETDGKGLRYFAMDINRRDLGNLPRDEYNMCPLSLNIDIPTCYDDRFSILQYCTEYELDLDNHRVNFKNSEDNKWYTLNTINYNIE